MGLRHVLASRASALGMGLLLTLSASAQDPPPLVLNPRVVPPPVQQVTTSCPGCQAYADEHNRIARRIDDLNFQLAHRRREADLERQAIAQVEGMIAQLQSAPASPERGARLKFQQQRLEAYRATLERDLAQAAALERLIAEHTAALATARATLKACEAACAANSASSQAAAGQPTGGQASGGNQAQSGGTASSTSGATGSTYTGRPYRWRTDEEIERDRIEQERLDVTLAAMKGDEWAAQLAALFTSTLFDTETPFDTAYGQNLRTLARVNALTPEQIAAAAELDRQNQRVAAQNAADRQAAIEASGDMLVYNYTRDARALIGPGYPGLANAGDSAAIAALLLQDSHVGQLLQFRRRSTRSRSETAVSRPAAS